MSPETFARVAKALADPRRFEILELVGAQGEIGCQRLCECFPVSQATISHHLKELATAGLVVARRDGQCVYYRMIPSTMAAYVDELQRRVPTAVRATPVLTGAALGAARAAVSAVVSASAAVPARV